jgi:hypothetical protein
MNLRKLTFTAAVQPVLTYASAIWSRSIQLHQEPDRQLADAASHKLPKLPANAAHRCVQQENGLQPSHTVRETAMLKFRHRLYHLPPTRPTRRVADAGPTTKWWKASNCLATEYNITTAGLEMSTKDFQKGDVECATTCCWNMAMFQSMDWNDW